MSFVQLITSKGEEDGVVEIHLKRYDKLTSSNHIKKEVMPTNTVVLQ